MQRRIFLYIMFCAGYFPAVSQTINPGTPFIINHPKQEYRAATQNWDIDQGPSGIMYFANNDGLLCYDGTKWQCLPLPNRTIVRSVAVDSLGNVYAGGQDELGVFRPDDKGELKFQSLKDRIPAAARKFEDVWDIVLRKDEMICRTNHHIYRFIDDTCQVFPANSAVGALLKAGNEVLFHDEGGLYHLGSDGKELIRGTEKTSGMTIVKILPWDNASLIIVTLKHGIFLFRENTLTPWETRVHAWMGSGRIHSAALLPEGKIAIGTSQNGLIILDRDGWPLYQLDKKNGIQNNNVLSLFADHAGNLWLGLNNGIDFVQTHSPFSVVFPDGNLRDAGYSAIIHNGNSYFGTNNGLYYSPWQPYSDPLQPGRFQRVENSTGQVWGTVSIGEHLFMGHHEGAFLIRDGKAIRISPTASNGTWTFLPLNRYPGYMISGTYNGVDLYHYRNNTWEFVKRLQGLGESCRIMAQDDAGNIWVAHPYRGIYRLEFPARPDSMVVRFYQAKDGLPFDNFNHVFRVRDQIMFATAQGVYNYVPEQDRFEPNEPFKQILGHEWVKLLREDREGNIWFVVNNDVGIIHVAQKGVETVLQREDFPVLKDKLVKGHEFLYPYDRSNVFFAAESGFLHYNPTTDIQQDSSISVLLTSVHLIGEKDSLVFGGIFSENGIPVATQPRGQKPVFRYKENAMRFGFSVPEFRASSGIEYSFFLEGLEDEWSSWTSKREKDYTNLNPGGYTFHLQAKNNREILSKEVTFSFVIDPPWYSSPAARSIYLLVILTVFISLLAFPRIKLRRETQKLQGIMKRQEEEQEAQISRLNNERLEEAVRHQNQELASATMHIVQKNDILFKIRGQLEEIAAISPNETVRKKVNNLLGLIHHDRQIDQDWEQFAFHFDQVHRDFLKRLGEEFPQLSPTDHRLCAYLRMNLSSKEIAPLMNISVRGVETGRYRLRKKMELDHDINLNEFMMKF
ncbi:MAG: triple tyrosine motif-containing protein [Bacteroidia bacterium]